MHAISRSPESPTHVFRRLLRMRTLCAAALLVIATAPARGGNTLEVVSIGLKWQFTIGRMTVLDATVQVDEAGEYRLAVYAPDPEGNTVRFTSPPLELSANTPASMSVRFVPGQEISSLRVAILQEDAEVATRTVRFGVRRDAQSAADADSELPPAPVAPAAHLVAALGNPQGLTELGPTVTDEGEESAGPDTRVISVDRSAFGNDPASLSGFRTIIVAGDYGLDAQQVSALGDWVRFQGGHLLVSVASGHVEYRSSPLGEWMQQWVPIEEDLSQLTELPGVEDFTDNIARVPLARRRATAARIGSSDGVTLVSGADGPLIEQVAVGFGRVTLIGLDLASGPLVNWDALPILMRRLVHDERRAKRSSVASSDAIGHNGITDLATQLHASQANFPDIGRFSSWTAMGLIVLYLLVIGPLDYLIVHRLLRRPHLTWLTFPVMVVLGCTVGILLARQSNGDELRFNQTTIVDIDASPARAFRQRSYFSVYTPESRRSEILVKPTEGLLSRMGVTTPAPALLTWTGIPENVFGGMLRGGGLTLGGVQWQSEEHRATGLPMAVWSASNLSASWTSEADLPVETSLRSSSVGLLEGTLTHNLGVPLRNWMLAHGLRIYRDPGATEFVSGAEWTPAAPDVERIDLESYMTGLRQVEVARRPGEGGETIRQEQAAYNSLSRDPAYVVRMLSLHDASGGRSYTGLTNTLLSESDLSQLIRLNRALLIGEVDLPAAELSLDGEQLAPTRTRTFVRILLPVEEAPTRNR